VRVLNERKFQNANIWIFELNILIISGIRIVLTYYLNTDIRIFDYRPQMQHKSIRLSL